MILVYHNVNIISKDENTVCLLYFFLHMLFLKFGKKNVVFLDEYDSNNTNHIVLRFDDGFENVYRYVVPILKIFKFKFELFICPSYINNKGFLSTKQLNKIQKFNCHLQYHTLHHYDLSLINDKNMLKKEIYPPKFNKKDLCNFKYLAYPYWRYNDKIVQLVKKYYKGALSGNGYADNTQYAMNGIKVLNTINIGGLNE